MQAGGAPEKVADAFRARMQAIDDDLGLASDQAVQNARTQADGLGLGAAPDVAGERLRVSLEEARGAAKTRERELWSHVDPDGTLALSPQNAKSASQKIRQSHPRSARPIEGEEASILDTLASYGEVVPFTELRAAQSRLTDAMRAERSTNGETATYRRMSQLNGAIHDDLARVVKARVMREEFDVQNGRMKPEDTMEAAIMRQREAWFADRSARAQSDVGGASGGGYSASGPFPVPGVRGTMRRQDGDLPRVRAIRDYRDSLQNPTSTTPRSAG